MKDIARAINAIKKARSIAIAGHINPDGDSVGSLLALGLAVMSMGKRVVMLSPDTIPDMYHHLPGASKIKERTTEHFDLAISVDCGARELLGASWATFEASDAILEIDHHRYRRRFGTCQLVDAGACAVGEVVYRLIKALRVKITGDIATNILAAIIVETGLFSQERVTAATFLLCSDLVEHGVDFSHLAYMVYRRRSRNSAVLSALCILRSRIVEDGKIAWSLLRRKDIRSNNGNHYDVDGVPGELCLIKGVTVSVFFRELDDNQLRVSMRSRGSVDVGRIAECFGGGGHWDMAGCVIPDTAKSRGRLLDVIAGRMRRRSFVSKKKDRT